MKLFLFFCSLSVLICYGVFSCYFIILTIHILLLYLILNIELVYHSSLYCAVSILNLNATQIRVACKYSI